MMRTNNIKILALLISLLSSCSVEEPDVQKYGTIHLSLGSCDGTRSNTASEAYEYAIHSLQVIVAGSDGRIEYYRELDGSGDFDIQARPGDKTVLAIANGPSFKSCGTLGQIHDTEIGLEQWNNVTAGFIMSDERRCRVAADSISVLPMELVRYVSRIRFTNVINKMDTEYGSLQVTGVMISNAVGNQNIAGNATEDIWLNPMGATDFDSLPPILGSEENESLSRNAEYNMEKNMYCFPNSTASDNQGFDIQFTPRYTRAVLSAVIRGQEYYYPISLPSIERNMTYDITLYVYHPGSVDPDIPVCPGYIRISIEAGLWTDGPEITEYL